MVVGRVRGVCHVLGRLLNRNLPSEYSTTSTQTPKVITVFPTFQIHHLFVQHLVRSSRHSPESFFASSQTFSCLSIENAKISIKANMSLFALRSNESHSRSSPSTCKQKKRGKFPERKTLFMSNCFHSPRGKNKHKFGCDRFSLFLRENL